MSLKRDVEKLEAVVLSLPDTTRARLVGASKAIASVVADLDKLFTEAQRGQLADGAIGVAQGLAFRAMSGRDWKAEAFALLNSAPALRALAGEVIAALPKG